MQAPASACTSRRVKARLAMWQAPSSTCCSRPIRRAVFRSRPITGTNGKTTTSRMLAHILKMSGLYGRHDVDRRRLHRRQALGVAGDMTGPDLGTDDPARSVRRCRGHGGRRAAACCAAVLGFQELQRLGLPERAADHLGLRGIDTLEQLAEVKRVPIEIAQDAAVLNADDAALPADGGLHRGEHVSAT